MTLPVIIDIEASGFGKGSYPIEVGYYMPGGNAYCTLIRPEPGWVHWDTSAEAVHGIAREHLVSHGKSALDVCRVLNRDLVGQRVYCDAWSYDYVWLSVMYDAVGLVPSFALGDIRELLSECEKSQWHEVRSLVELRLALKRHRASGDARTLFETLLETRQLCAGSLIV